MTGKVDDNKTALTHRVTAIAAAFLDGMGFKPVETEVQVARGWVADLASFIYPTHTEAKKLHVDKHSAEWLGEADLDKRLYFYGGGPLTGLVEVKVTRADYAKDVHRKFEPWPPAHLCFLAFPHGVLTADDVPTGWYGLEMTSKGSRLRKIHRVTARCHAQHPGFIADFIAQVAIRRDHRTRYAGLRAFVKGYRAEETERRKVEQLTSGLRIVLQWMRGESHYRERSAEEMLERLLNRKVPEYLREEIRWMEELRAE